jgi:sugar-specific transcriptional regulator TrmB
LQSLKEQGLIEEQEIRNRKAYLASDPESLLRNWQRKKETIEQLLPDLRGIYTTQKNKPKIRFYEGAEQVKEIYENSLLSQEVLAIGSTNQMSILFPEFTRYYFEELKKRQIVFYDVLTHESEKVAIESKDTLKGLYDFKLLPNEYQDPPTDILIWENNIALITLKEPIFGTVLSNQLLTQTFRTLFKLIWTR